MRKLKKYSVVVIFLIILFSSCLERGNMVMICVSPTSHRYHVKRCRGVKACTHEIKKVSIEEAENLGKTPCGYCY